jgi:predicted transcriptional regulator
MLLAPSGRLDEGLMDQRLDQLATAIDYDRATEQFKDEA